MKKWWVTILMGIYFVPSFSQQARVDFTRIDREALAIQASTPQVLAEQLTASRTGELEKVRAIFRWITENIEYRVKDPIFYKHFNSAIYNPEEDTSQLKPLDEHVAELVLKKGTAVCDGYARLFKTLCTYAGIRSELITGYARSGTLRPTQRFHSNHTWNAVMIDSAWKLLDVTWASGYVSWWRNTFTKELDENYFLAAPEDFIRDHYPDDIHWSLLEEPPVMSEFRYSPYKQKTFLKYSIRSFTPAKGMIEAQWGDTIQIEIETSNPSRDQQIGSDPFLDTSVYTTSTSVLLQPSSQLKNKTIYTYTVNSTDIKWIYILYNEDVILRYRLSFNQGKPQSGSK